MFVSGKNSPSWQVFHSSKYVINEIVKIVLKLSSAHQKKNKKKLHYITIIIISNIFAETKTFAIVCFDCNYLRTIGLW